jgi:hypothetical protein
LVAHWLPALPAKVLFGDCVIRRAFFLQSGKGHVIIKFKSFLEVF